MWRLVFTVSAGVLAALLADSLRASVLQPWPALRWPIVMVVGIAAALTAYIGHGRARKAPTTVLSKIKARGIRVKKLRHRDDGKQGLEALSQLDIEADLDVGDVDIDRRGNRDG